MQHERHDASAGRDDRGAAATHHRRREQQPTAAKTLGFYVQEQAAFRDRLFLTVAARTDQNSAFGTNFQRVVYPKASASWLVSDESFFPHYRWLNSVPPAQLVRRERRAAGPHVGPRAVPAEHRGARCVTARRRRTTRRASRRATRQREPQARASAELEGGFETQMLNNRVHFDYTYYNKKTNDALINVPIAGSAGAPVTSLLQNVGSTRNYRPRGAGERAARRPPAASAGT